MIVIGRGFNVYVFVWCYQPMVCVAATENEVIFNLTLLTIPTSKRNYVLGTRRKSAEKNVCLKVGKTARLQAFVDYLLHSTCFVQWECDVKKLVFDENWTWFYWQITLIYGNSNRSCLCTAWTDRNNLYYIFNVTIRTSTSASRPSTHLRWGWIPLVGRSSTAAR